MKLIRRRTTSHGYAAPRGRRNPPAAPTDPNGSVRFEFAPSTRGLAQDLVDDLDAAFKCLGCQGKGRTFQKTSRYGVQGTWQPCAACHATGSLVRLQGPLWSQQAVVVLADFFTNDVLITAIPPVRGVGLPVIIANTASQKLAEDPNDPLELHRFGVEARTKVDYRIVIVVTGHNPTVAGYPTLPEVVCEPVSPSYSRATGLAGKPKVRVIYNRNPTPDETEQAVAFTFDGSEP